VDGTHFSIKNLPKGCNAKLEVVSAVKAVLALEGKALYHEKENSTTNIELEFLYNRQNILYKIEKHFVQKIMY
jgi:hypothetical protein